MAASGSLQRPRLSEGRLDDAIPRRWRIHREGVGAARTRVRAHLERRHCLGRRRRATGVAITGGRGFFDSAGRRSCDRVRSLLNRCVTSCCLQRESAPFLPRPLYFSDCAAANGPKKTKKLSLRPQIRREYPLNLSISVSGGKETNEDSSSNGE